LDTESEPGGRRGACTRVGVQLGVNAEALRGLGGQFEVNQGGRAGVTQPSKPGHINTEKPRLIR
jgi:transposase